MIFIATGADKLLAEFLAPFKVSHLLCKVVPVVKTGPPKQLVVFFCSWVVISRNNLPCGYLVLPGLAGTQEDAESTGEGIVERRRLNRLVFSKGLEIDEAQISGKVQINMYFFKNRFLDLAEQHHISGTNPDCCQVS